MSVSASETGKAESRAKAKAPRQYTEECRLEAAGHCRKAREADPKKSIRECAAEPGTSDKTPSGWAIRHGRTGKVTQARTDGQKEPGGARRHIREPGSENEFPRKAAAFFARNL
jgi:transposase-like protein